MQMERMQMLIRPQRCTKNFTIKGTCIPLENYTCHSTVIIDCDTDNPNLCVCVIF